MDQKTPMSNNQLPADVSKRIWADAEKYAEEKVKAINDEHFNVYWAYIAGATAEAEQAKQTYDYAREMRKDNERLRSEVEMHEAAKEHVQVLVDALEWIKTYGPVNNRAVKFIDKALQQWKEGKEVEPVKEIEYMPILSAELSELKAIANVPLRVPMHLLNEDQAQSNHGQSLQRLKERGGLSIRESLSLITRQHWRYYSRMDNKKAVIMLNELITNPPK